MHGRRKQLQDGDGSHQRVVPHHLLEDADLDGEADAANAVEAVPDDDAATYTGAAATGWDSDAAEGVPIAAIPSHPAMIPSLPTHLCDNGTSLGTAWEGPTDTRRRICYYCQEPLHRNLSKGDAHCNACYKMRYHAQLPRMGCARHCSYCFSIA